MNTITLPRATVEQALEALENEHRSPRGYGYELSVYEMRETSAAITALRAALAQQAEPVQMPGKFDHGIGADRFKVVRGAYWWHILIGDSQTKRGKFHTQAGAEEMAALLLREFRNGAFVRHEAALAQHSPATLIDPRGSLGEPIV